jgi:hypothetical protein
MHVGNALGNAAFWSSIAFVAPDPSLQTSAYGIAAALANLGSILFNPVYFLCSQMMLRRGCAGTAIFEQLISTVQGKLRGQSLHFARDSRMTGGPYFCRI